jgi:hypothetical protein
MAKKRTPKKDRTAKSTRAKATKPKDGKAASKKRAPKKKEKAKIDLDYSTAKLTEKQPGTKRLVSFTCDTMDGTNVTCIELRDSIDKELLNKLEGK